MYKPVDYNRANGTAISEIYLNEEDFNEFKKACSKYNNV